MKIKVSEIPARGSVVDFDLDTTGLESRINAPGVSPVFTVVGPVKAHAEAHLNSGTVTLNSNFDLELKTECTRCLNEVNFELHKKFEMVFKQAQDTDQVPDVGIDFYRDDLIDCEEVVQEQIAMNLPENPSCELAGCKCEILKETWGEAIKDNFSGLLKKAFEGKV